MANKVKETNMEVRCKNQCITDKYSIYNGDCVKVMRGIPDDSIGFSVFSPPFADLFAYSDATEDLGNCKSYDQFFVHYGFLVDQLFRAMMPGRIVAIHCMDLPTHKSSEGYIGIRDFPGDIVRSMESKGFIFASRHCIWKDPLIAATRTKALGLAHKQIVKDSSMCRTGIPDYVLAFRKRGQNPIPIEHPLGLSNYVGSRSIPRELEYYRGYKDPKTNKLSHWIWQSYASPVWDDIRQGRILPYKKAKEEDDQKHLCCLQLDVIERCLVLWSNPGDIVLSPFGGAGSEAVGAISMGRKAVSIELKSSYYRQMKRNLEGTVQKMKQSKSEVW